MGEARAGGEFGTLVRARQCDVGDVVIWGDPVAPWAIVSIGWGDGVVTWALASEAGTASDVATLDADRPVLRVGP